MSGGAAESAETGVKWKIEDALLAAVGAAPGDPGAVTHLLDNADFMSAVAEYCDREDLTFAKLTWPTRGKKGGKGSQATPTWLIVKGRHASAPGETWRIATLSIPTRINLAFTPLQKLRPSEEGRFSLSGCHVRLPRAFVIAVVESCMKRTVIKQALDKPLNEELSRMVLDRSFINNHQRMTKLEFSSNSEIRCLPDVRGYYGSGQVTFRLQLRDRSNAIAKGSPKGTGVDNLPANVSLVLKAVAVKVVLGHGVESYWDKDDAAQDGLGFNAATSEFATNVNILRGDDKKSADDAMTADTANYIAKRYGDEVAEAFTNLFGKALEGKEFTDDEKKLYDRFCVRIATRARTGGADDPEKLRFGGTNKGSTKGAEDPMSAYSRLLAAQVNIDPGVARAADKQNRFNMGDTESDDDDEDDDDEAEAAAKRARTGE